ncbi:hypothetical protein GCM10009834_03780 [Streptomonospora arabica]
MFPLPGRFADPGRAHSGRAIALIVPLPASAARYAWDSCAPNGSGRAPAGSAARRQ